MIQHYINQLLAELRDRHDKQPPPVDYRLLHPESALLPEKFDAFIARTCAPEQSFEELFDLPAEAFPPPEKLSEQQMQAVLDGILALWAAWRIYPEVPKGVPVATLYRVVADFWRKDIVSYASGYKLHFKLCDYKPKHCVWGSSAYCSCKDFI